MSFDYIFFCILLSSPVVLWYMLFYRPRKRLYELAAVIPGFPGLPLIGNTLHFSRNSLKNTKKFETLMYKTRQLGGVMKLWFGPQLTVALLNPCDAEIILNKELKKDPVYRFIKPWLGDGLLTADVSTWKVHRKMLLPAFKQKTLDGFIEIFYEKSEIMVEKLLKTKGTLDAIEYTAPCTLDFICESALAVQVNAQNNVDALYFHAGVNLFKVFVKRVFQPWLYADWIYKLTDDYKKQTEYVKILQDFTTKIIKIRKQNFTDEMAKNDEKNFYVDDEFSLSTRNTFVDLLLKLSHGEKQWSDKMICDEISTITLGGFDTTSNTTAFALILIGSHPQVQEKLFQELYTIFGDSKRPIIKEDISKMQYMDRVIKETLRLFPIGSIVLRRLQQELKIENYTLPVGTGCLIGIYGIHRDPSIWGDNPDSFNPDNFLPENSAKRHPYSFIPFGAGPRNCIGKQYAMMSMKVMLATVLRSLKLHSSVDYKNMNLAHEVFLKSLDGYQVSVEPRF